METVLFLLSLSGYILLKVIIVLLLAIPSGIGLAAGFHVFKQWIARWEKKSKNPMTPEEIEKKYGNFFQQEVQQGA